MYNLYIIEFCIVFGHNRQLKRITQFIIRACTDFPQHSFWNKVNVLTHKVSNSLFWKKNHGKTISMIRVRTGPGNPGKPWKIFEALEIPGNPGKALEFFL